jgi:hypothetical protein
MFKISPLVYMSYPLWFTSRNFFKIKPIFLLSVLIFLLASKCLVCQLPTLGIDIHLRQTISIYNTAQNLHGEPIHPRKVHSHKYSIPALLHMPREYGLSSLRK